MKRKLIRWLPAALLVAGLATVFVVRNEKKAERKFEEFFGREEGEEESENEEMEKRALYAEARARYDFDMLKDPVTGKVPRGIFDQERTLALGLPEKGQLFSPAGRTAQTTVMNSYNPAGPNNIGGRTRGLTYDLRFNGGSNRVIIAGCVSGGMMRSDDGGQHWTRVSPENDIHNFTALAQDPRPGSQDTWYAGGGEAYGNSTSELGAIYKSNGLWKSTDNGVTWTKLPHTNVTDIDGTKLSGNVLESFDHPFDYIHKIKVNPANGDLYVAAHQRLFRSSDGGQSFRAVFGSTVSSTAVVGQMDLAIQNSGKVLLAVNGGNPINTIRGVWVSETGNTGSFQRIAGGQTLGVDSIPGWRGNASNNASRRILIALSPSDQNIGYVLYENGLSSSAPFLQPEADFYRLNISGNSYTWINRSANMPNFPGNLAGSDPLALQAGYNMLLEVKPNDPHTVFVGGTNLYRSSDGFASTGNTAWINGYTTDMTYNYYPNGHPDIHSLTFNPADNNTAICGDDGGIRLTSNISASSVSWSPLPNYQTLQYYYVAIDPDAARYNFAGGSQDNGVLLRDKAQVIGTAVQDSNNHVRLYGGDGCAVGYSRLDPGTGDQFVYGGSQYGNIRRIRISPSRNNVDIRPTNLTTARVGAVDEYGEFVTNFRLDPDNTELLYYVNFNRLFRTTSAATVTNSNWTELTGVRQAVNPNNPTSGRDVAIRALAFTRGTYTAEHALFIGTTNGKIFRLDNPRNAAASTVPVNITPSGMPAGVNVQDIAVNPENDNELVAVVSNYTINSANAVSIWHTTNAKSASPTWRNREGNLQLPSIRSCAIVVKKDTSGASFPEYYVGTSVGLYSTTNITADQPVWLREGGNLLNYAVIQSLAYRPDDNVLLVGTHGNGLFYANMGKFTTPSTEGELITRFGPTVTRTSVQYLTGNLPVQKLHVRLFNMQGQLLLKEERGYTGGVINMRPYAYGVYIVSIISDDGKYKFTQKVVKQ
ncbi:T9SS type A sorting domain-containing protein [Paraflavisolibacter sp. H34]|uniref:T9SS type A sorting domain-containing protein n=1 Tax=Huijunlia imazamoxiresistens TaxID=3127457 RepID=UPI003017B8D0